jgi:hypothetical protein
MTDKLPTILTACPPGQRPYLEISYDPAAHRFTVRSSRAPDLIETFPGEQAEALRQRYEELALPLGAAVGLARARGRPQWVRVWQTPATATEEASGV